MKRAAYLAVAAAALITAGCASGSGGANNGGSGSSTTGHVVTPPLTTSASTATTAWGIVVMGGSAADEDNFWQLFTRPAGADGKWALVTPPGVATNGGLVMAPTAGSPAAGSLVVGIRPSQDLSFSPLAATTDDGKAWSPSVMEAELADDPDSLAAASAAGKEYALLGNGSIDQASASTQAWSKLTGPGAAAASAAGKTCGLSSLDSITVTPSGEPLIGGACGSPGVTGIFGYSGGTWHAAGPVLPGSAAKDRVQVLRLTATAAGNTALLLAGSSLFAAWTSDGGAHWTVSPPLSLGTGLVSSAAFDADGAVGVLLSGGHAATVGGPGASWQSLPATPPGTAVLAFVPSSASAAPAAKNDAAKNEQPAQVQALAVRGAQLIVWQADASTGKWADVQTISVPIQYGSSA
jgi:hypothetical protein